MRVRNRISLWWHNLWCGGYWIIDVDNNISQCGFCGRTWWEDASI